MEHVSHEFEPVWNKDSRVLVLGTFPSVKSRQQKFYYGHPQNRFWKVTAALLERSEEHTSELQSHHDPVCRAAGARSAGKD